MTAVRADAYRPAPVVLEVVAGITIVAVCDSDLPAALAVSGPHGAHAYEHWDEMLETETPDAAWVCTPPLGHTEPAIAALERRVHVYLEKPIARTLPDAERMVAATTCIEAIYVVGYQWRALEFLDHIHNALAHRGTRRRRTRGRRPGKVDVRRAGRLCGAQ